MTYYFAKHLLLRMPVKKVADYASNPQKFLDDQFFLTAIRVATPVFYKILEHRYFQLEKLTIKEIHTLQKYINRYCFRPTPFGLFSTVTLLDWSGNAAPNSGEPGFKMHVSTAMTAQTQLSFHLLHNELRQKAVYVANPSIYRILNEYRFFRTSLDDRGEHRDYQLQSIAFSKLLKDLITNEKKNFTKQEIVSQIINSAASTADEAEDYADFLIDAQLLVHDHRLSITGEDPLKRLSRSLENGPFKTSLLYLLELQRKAGHLISLEQIKQLENVMSSLLLQNAETSDKLSVILQREIRHQPVEIGWQHPLQDGIAALELLSPVGQIANLSSFIKSFQQHFEGRSMPLLMALDPEAGIGYQLPETEKNNPMLETLNIPNKKQVSPSGSWSSVHRLLLEAWLRDRSETPVINLDDHDLAQLKTPEDPQQILGMSVLFRQSGNKLYIENAGGINAPALMGRFSVADERIAKAAQSMARQLEEQNPDIIFAELLHLADPHTDNINRRAHIYQYELPVTAASMLPGTQQISLSDLYIRIVNNMVILYSEKHQKIVIPRLTSAYNHSLNKLPLFRFLADLPYQYARSSLSLDLLLLFPNLRFYPRVEYKDTILSLATWIINTKQLAELQHSDQQQSLKRFQQLHQDVRLPRYFLLAEGDQELVFDAESNNDIVFFCNCVRQKKEVVLKEYLKQPAAMQYNAYLLPSKPMVMPQFNPQLIQVKARRKYMPGSEWLYLKIYAPKIGINRLLLRLGPLLRKRYGEHRIIQWFFIRYDDHAPHIRLRLQINPAVISDVLIAFKAKLEDRIQQQVIREFQVDVYTRELERYAAGGIENTERFFWSDSELILHFMKHRTKETAAQTHSFALYSTKIILDAFITNPEEQLSFTLNCFQLFLPEFTDKPFKVELDKKYRELSSDIQTVFAKDDPALLSGSVRTGNQFLKSLKIISKTISDQDQRMEYLRSIIHMHLNRIFTDESRKQEMICYYLLHKYLLSVKGRHKRMPLQTN